ncbi:MAG: purple acid phosphatase family protein, partial [Myxococcaceae bacterium]
MKLATRALLLCAVLFAADAQALAITRGPFLQRASDQGVTVVFLTDTAATATVRYGASRAQLTSQVSDGSATTTHVLAITGLTPSTRYYYQVESGGQVLAGGPDFTFRTYPVKGSPEPFSFLAWGDSGTGGTGQWAVADRLKALNVTPDFGLILGDIIYPGGEAALYDPRYFQPYQALLRKMVIWPTIGNHDVVTAGGQPYLDAFYLPTNNPASSELYHSWDYGNAHFVCLDTHVSSFSAGSAQLQWAAQDLAASTARWKFAYFHVPPYSGGTHLDSASVKANILPVLEAAGVDVVFSGHSHVYERTFLLKANAVVQNHAAVYDQRVAPGSIYVVSGTAGQSGALANASHPLMAFQRGSILGSSIIEVSGPVLRGYFLDQANQAIDLFTLYKNSDDDPPRLGAVRARSATQVEVTFNEPVGNGAQTAANYSISPQVAVLGAALQGDGRTVLLSTAPHLGGTHRLTVSGVHDTASPTPNPIVPGSFAYYELPLNFVVRGGPWRYLVGSVDPAAGWTGANFADGSWTQGASPIGYGETGLGSTVPAATLTVYARAAFTVTGPAEISKLGLQIRYDDGVVVFLNGAEVARRGVPANQTRSTPSSLSHEATAFETIDLTGEIGRLVAGPNVLAVEVHNVGTTSSDLLIDAELSAEKREASAPYLVSHLPADGATGVALDAAISAQVKDDASAISPADITLT